MGTLNEFHHPLQKARRRSAVHYAMIERKAYPSNGPDDDLVILCHWSRLDPAHPQNRRLR
jgi:hypothetical protein